MAQIEEKAFDIKGFFESRQLIAGDLGDIHSQRRLTEIRQAIAEQKAEELRQQQLKAAEKQEKEATKKTKASKKSK